jgi:hypothetical protein
MPKRKCCFNDELQKEFPYLKKSKTDHEVNCTHCGATFSVAHDGRADITDQLKSGHHKNSVEAKASKGWRQ